jgi:hypothetical protein
MSPLALFAIAVLVTIIAAVVQPYENTMTSPLRQAVKCKCGKVKLQIDSPSALRFLCYSKDYRGYYYTLAKANNHQPNAALDPWGG